MKRIMLTISVLLSTTTAFAEPSDSTGGQKVFRVKAIDATEDGMLGFKRLYFPLACDEGAVQLLTQSAGQNRVDIAMLVRSNGQPCSTPDREGMTKIIPGRSELQSVDHFEEVWYCSGWCNQQTSPGYPPSNRFTEAFGTSERQAHYNMSCSSGWMTGERCQIVPVEP